MIVKTYAERTLYKPIDFFFRGVADVKTGEVKFIDAFQILNDRFLGRMNVCNYFYIAENSIRINELNVIALDELINYHFVMRENFFIPEKVLYSVPITTRFLEDDKDFEILLATLKENGYKKGSLVLTFNCNTLIALDDEAKARYDKLRKSGFKICVSGFGEEFNQLDIFARYNFDFLRSEAEYFDATPPKKRVLGMLIKYCGANKIEFVMEGVDSPSQRDRFKRAGIRLMTGKAVSKLSRYVTNDLLGLPEPDEAARKEITAALQKQLDSELEKERAERERLRLEAIEKAKAEGGGRKPSAPRPELMKSPYQVRLERQREAAKKAAIERGEVEERRPRRKTQGRPDVVFGRRGDKTVFTGRPRRREYLYDILATEEAPLGRDREEIDSRPERDEEVSLKRMFLADVETESRLMSEVRAGSLENALSGGEAFGGFGVNLRGSGVGDYSSDPDSELFDEYGRLIRERAPIAEADEEFTTVKKKTRSGGRKTGGYAEGAAYRPEDGTYNERGQWVAPDGSVYDGYFDSNGQWHDFLRPEDGSYNEQGQWVSPDGTVYNGYFDDEGEWHDYLNPEDGSYNEQGQWVAPDGTVYNGYFDENGEWHDYEEFATAAEGSYNEFGQWVDAEGTVYDGYFDEQGRWIDYTYVNESGESVDNGYFDEKIGKWIPFGYFDDDGVWHKID